MDLIAKVGLYLATNLIIMIQFRLTIVSFLQFFIWGSWLITIGAFWFENKQWGPAEFGAIFSTMGISALFMPAITGVIADRYMRAERLYGLLHILGAIGLWFIPFANSPSDMFWRILITMIFYMPTISLSNTVSYSILSQSAGINVVKTFPVIRVWGTVGFIIAESIISLTNQEKSVFQFQLAAVVSVVLGVYAFTLPACPPLGKGKESNGWASMLGLNAFSMLKEKRYLLFFMFSMLLGAALQLTNAYGATFLHTFEKMPEFKDSIAVKFPALTMSLSQISETLFILAIPFFMRRFNIKQVMLMSMFAWVLRFGLLAYGDPGSGLWMILLSCIIYGMAFDFFNISGSLYIETQVDPAIRSSAQGLFTMMVNGVGAVFGSLTSGFVMAVYFTDEAGDVIWQPTWIAFAGYALVVAILFAVLFKVPNRVPSH